MAHPGIAFKLVPRLHAEPAEFAAISLKWGCTLIGPVSVTNFILFAVKLYFKNFDRTPRV